MNHWIFQGNPEEFEVNKVVYPNIDNMNEYLSKNEVIDWNIKHPYSPDDFFEGDPVFIWRFGNSDFDNTDKGEIVALGEIESINTIDSVSLKIKIIEERTQNNDSALSISNLKSLPETQELAIFKNPQATNYKLSKMEYIALLEYWHSPDDFEKLSNKTLTEKYLLFYRDNIDTLETEFESLKDSYTFFQQFKQPGFINQMEWEDFQKIGNHLYVFNMAIAKKRALGNSNYDIEHYRKSFDYLINSSDAIEIKIDNFLNNPDYKLFGFGESAVSEILGHLFPEKYCFYNLRDKVAVENILKLEQNLTRGDTYADKYVKFQNSIHDNAIISQYLDIVGKQTDLPIYYEIDQFFSALTHYQSKQTKKDSEETIKDYWVLTIAPEKSWKDYQHHNKIFTKWPELGNLQEYKSKNEIRDTLKSIHNLSHSPDNDTLANYQFAFEMKEGDEVFLKSSSGMITGVASIVSDYYYTEENGSYRDVEWLNIGEWDFKDTKISSKFLTKITPYKDELNLLLERCKSNDNSTVTSDSIVNVSSDYEPYTIENNSGDLFMELDTIEDALESLNYKKNIILQGPPGVGKTYTAKRLAYFHMGKKSPENIEMIQFHQSYSYEEFIQGFKPNKTGDFTLQNGIFYNFCNTAKQNKNEKFYFVIDEINRGNLSKIFGEVMMLMESDKRGHKNAIKLTYNDEDKFYIPDNVYIIATMNTADRSLALVDYALRRRFAFIHLNPGHQTEAFLSHLSKMGISFDTINKVITFIDEANQLIISDEINLGKGFEIGHSFFTPTEFIEDENVWFNRILKLEIIPLLTEYWFDEEEKINELIDRYQ